MKKFFGIDKSNGRDVGVVVEGHISNDGIVTLTKEKVLLHIEGTLYVIAGSFWQAQYLAKANYLDRKSWKYVSSIEDLYGVQGSICFYGVMYRSTVQDRVIDYAKELIQTGRLKEVMLSDA